MTDQDSQLIMVVDNESVITTMVRRILVQDGWPETSILSFNQPEKVVDYLSDKSNSLPALIITDNEMNSTIGGSDIIQLAQEKSIPAILMSGRSDIAEPIARELRVFFLSKPFNLNGFRNAVRTVLKSSTS